MAARHGDLIFEPRFCGPPGTVNGGFACGAVAARLGGVPEVTLRRPIPLGRPLAVQDTEDAGLAVSDRGTLLAEARPAAGDVVAPLTVPVVPAEMAGPARYYSDPAFPGCFVCGPDRADGDGLRILPGAVTDRSVWAAPWTPHPSVAAADGRVRSEIVWAALDCPSGIAAGEAAGLPDDTTALLGRMAAQVTERPLPGQACRVVAWPLARTERTLTAGSALLGPDDEVLATARTVWVIVPRPTAGAGS